MLIKGARFKKTCPECNLSKNLSCFRVGIRDKLEKSCNTCRGIPISDSLKRAKKFKKAPVDKKRAEGECLSCKEKTLPFSKCHCEKHFFEKCARSHLNNPKLGEQLKRKLELQHYKCIYSGRDLVLGVNAELDHIIPRSKNKELEQEISNLQWVDSEVNLMKNGLLEEDFFYLCGVIYMNNNLYIKNKLCQNIENFLK